MNIFKRIFHFFKVFRNRFFKKNQKDALYERMKEVKSRKLVDIAQRISRLVDEPDCDPEDIKALLEEKTLIELNQGIGEEVVEIFEERELIFDIVEIEQEVNSLNSRLFSLESRSKQVKNVEVVGAQGVDIGRLESFMESYYSQKESYQNPSTSIGQIEIIEPDDFFQKFELIKIFQTREERKKQEERLNKNKVRSLLKQIEKGVNKKSIAEVKKMIKVASDGVLKVNNKQDKKIFSERLIAIKVLLRKREIEVEAKRQADILKKKREAEALKEKELELKRINEQKRQEMIAEVEKRFTINPVAEKKKRSKDLKALPAKKSNWKEFANVLKQNRITTFYHFTDKKNIPSIKKNGGLYSWYYCEENNIYIDNPGGDGKSRSLDERHGLEDYVRLSFCSSHPMQYRLQQSGFNLELLRIDIDVAYFEHTSFSDMNATDNNHSVGSTIEDLNRVKFSATKQRYLRREDSDFKFHQAEILVKTWIPIKYITNINHF